MTEDNMTAVGDGLPTQVPPDLIGEQPAGQGKAVPWKGRKRVEEPRDKVLRIRCSGTELKLMDARATETGLSLGAYLRTVGTGKSGPRAKKRPRIEMEQIARLLALVGNMASNHNQIGKWCNTQQSPASAAELAAIKEDVAVIRAALMGALGRDQ